MNKGKKTAKAERKFPPGFPVDELTYRIVKFYMLGALVWDYTDTVLDIVSQQRRQELKKLTRAVRQLKADYDSYHRAKLPRALIEREEDMSLKFEALCEKHLSKFYEGIGYESIITGLAAEERVKVKAVVAAHTVLISALNYAKECDAWLKENGLPNYSILDSRFAKLSMLLPEFAGDSYPHGSKWIVHTAKAFLNELKLIELYGGSGENQG